MNVYPDGRFSLQTEWRDGSRGPLIKVRYDGVFHKIRFRFLPDELIGYCSLLFILLLFIAIVAVTAVAPPTVLKTTSPQITELCTRH